MTGKTFARLLQVLVFAAFLLQGFVFLGKTWWFFELFTHYPVYYALAFSALTLPCLNQRLWKSVLVLLTLVSINLTTFAPYLEKNEPTTPAQPSNEATPLTVLSSNFLYTNTNFDELSPLLAQENPDIFVIHEANEGWRQAREATLQDYPYQYMTKISGVHGIVVASRIPGSFKEIPVDESETESFVEFVPSDRSFRLLAVHPNAPLTANLAAGRNVQLEKIADYLSQPDLTETAIEQADLPTLVIGDFNCTPFSPYFKDLLAATELRDARLGFGLIPTWHAHNALFQIPIDHALVSQEFEVLDFYTTQKISPDHLPIVIKLELPDEESSL